LGIQIIEGAGGWESLVLARRGPAVGDPPNRAETRRSKMRGTPSMGRRCAGVRRADCFGAPIVPQGKLSFFKGLSRSTSVWPFSLILNSFGRCQNST
jgi:hypothetical protein